MMRATRRTRRRGSASTTRPQRPAPTRPFRLPRAGHRRQRRRGDGFGDLGELAVPTDQRTKATGSRRRSRRSAAGLHHFPGGGGHTRSLPRQAWQVSRKVRGSKAVLPRALHVTPQRYGPEAVRRWKLMWSDRSEVSCGRPTSAALRALSRNSPLQPTHKSRETP